MPTTTTRSARLKQNKRSRRTAAGVPKAGDPSSSAPSTKTLAKTADSKGRVVLGGQFANRAVLVEQLSETEVLVKMARVIPEREAWLYENPIALAAVREGLAEARAGKMNRGPNLRADEALVSQLED